MNIKNIFAGLFAAGLAVGMVAAPASAGFVYGEDHGYEDSELSGCIIDADAFREGVEYEVTVTDVDLGAVEAGEVIDFSVDLSFDYGLPTCFSELAFAYFHVEMVGLGDTTLDYTNVSPWFNVATSNEIDYTFEFTGTVPELHDEEFSDTVRIYIGMDAWYLDTVGADLGTGALSY